jgi:hypothetical protein
MTLITLFNDKTKNIFQCQVKLLNCLTFMTIRLHLHGMGHKDKTQKRQSNIYTNGVTWQHPISQNPMTKLNQIQNQSLKA